MLKLKSQVKTRNQKKKSKKASVDAEEDDVKGNLKSANKIEAELGELADVSASLTGTIGKAGKSKQKDGMLDVGTSINALI